MILLEKIEISFGGLFPMKLSYVQFAKDYNFEEAWILKPGDEPDNSNITSYISNGSYKSICCELFFSTPSEEYLIIGFSSTDNRYGGFITDSLEFSNNQGKIDEYLDNISKDSPDLVRIGILDYWFKTGLATMWEKGDIKEFSLKSIDEKLSKTPQLLVTDLKPQGMSFYYSESKNNPEHWIMYDISTKQGDKFIINKDKVLSLLTSKLS